MSNWPNLKIDIWWKAVLILGVLATIGAATFEIKFLESKHLFGFGIGLIFIGIGYWKAWKTISQILPTGILSTKGYKHDLVSVILIILGVLLIGLFGYLIVNGLI